MTISRAIAQWRRLVPVFAILCLLGLGASDAVSGTISDTDDWQGATVTTHTGVISGSNPNGLFTSNLGSVEPGKTLFRDHPTAGTLHSIEWETAGPKTIQALTLWAAHDYGKTARGLSRFRVWAFDDDAQGFTKQLCDISLGYPYGSLTATDYYENVSTGLNNGLELNVNVAPVTATRWRAEFRQMTGGAWAGPRVMELDGFSSRHAGLTGTAPLEENVWHLADVKNHSGVLSGSSVDNIFGRAYGSVEGSVGRTLFRDDQSAGFNHWIEFETPTLVEIRSFFFHCGHDLGYQRRGISDMRLYAWDEGTGSYSNLLFEMDFGWPYSATIDRPDAINVGTSNALMLKANVPTTTAKRFRAEFTQLSGPPWPGPRIDELSASGSPAGGVTPPADPGTSTIEAAPMKVSAYGGVSEITVTIRDENGDIVTTEADVDTATTAGTLVGAPIYQGDGTYTQELQASDAATQAVVSAVVDGQALTQTASVTFVPVDLEESSVTVTPETALEGGAAVVVATLRDDVGAQVGGGFSVAFQTTLGELVGPVNDLGDGRYSQSLKLSSPGTASLTAAVEGLALADSASIVITAIDDVPGVAIGERADGTIEGYDTIQEAVNAVETDTLRQIHVKPGVHNEHVLLKDLAIPEVLVLRALSGSDPVVVDGFTVSKCENIDLVGFKVDASTVSAHGIQIKGGASRSTGIRMRGCTVINTASSFDGIRVGRGNVDVTIRDCVIENNGQNGIRCMSDGGTYTIHGNRIEGNAAHGIRLGKNVVATLEDNEILDNGASAGGYGLYVQRQKGGGFPEDITLLQNVFDGNHGKVVAGKSDEDIRNYDQVIDPTDDQPPY